MTAEDGGLQPSRWRTAAHAIAQDLANGAVWDGDLCAFHGATPPDSLRQPPRFRSVRGDLYEGSAGIARFLAAAAMASPEAGLRRTALGAIRHAFATAEGWPLFTGGVGIAVAALEVAESLEEPDLVPPAVALLERASHAATSHEVPHDLLVGAAGVIVGLLAAVDYDLDGEWLRRAVDIGDILRAAAVPDGPEGPDGQPLSWPLAPHAGERLCGLAHGASGVAYALDMLAGTAAADSPDAAAWRQTARRARAWERAHFSSADGSWADLRRPESGAAQGPLGYPHMWCHGSIGIAAERLNALAHDPMARADALGGLAGARAHAERLLAGPVGPGATEALNGSLCHGVGGMIDLFVDAWVVTGDTSWMATAGAVADLLINDSRRVGGWRSGIAGGWTAPGLMLGNAGIGWALLRTADPERVASGWRVGPRTERRAARTYAAPARDARAPSVRSAPTRDRTGSQPDE